MKRRTFLLLSLLMFLGAAQAQTKPVEQVVIKTPGALCEECKNRIELYLSRQYGIGTVNVNFRKGETRVRYLTDRTDIEQIKVHISNVGYDADDVPADEKAYSKLPRSCRKAEDGGHSRPQTPPPAPLP